MSVLRAAVTAFAVVALLGFCAATASADPYDHDRDHDRDHHYVRHHRPPPPVVTWGYDQPAYVAAPPPVVYGPPPLPPVLNFGISIPLR